MMGTKAKRKTELIQLAGAEKMGENEGKFKSKFD